MNALLQTLRNLGPARLVTLGGVAAALIVFLLYVTSRLAGPDMALLYADLEAVDSSKIVQRLEASGTPYELRGDGSRIMVPRDQALRLRMAMAAEGLPSGGSVGYEIFDRTEAFGTTSFVQQVNHLRALEGELARTIGSIAQVRSARVHLVIPERELFSRDRPEPSASIILVVAGPGSIEKAQVLAIQHLVASAVPGLKPSSISIVDNQGTLLARGAEGGDQPTGAGAEELRLAYESRMTRAIEDLLQRSLGYGKARAEVSVEMDFDRVTTNSETFDPDGQVIRSTQTVEEQADSTDGAAGDAVTVGTNLPDPNLAAPGGAQSATRSARTEETVNYEVSKTVETHVREAGSVRRVSVAVLVDGTYEAAADGTTTYQPRSAEDLAQIDKLIRSAIGYNAERGDTLEVVNMRFAEFAEAEADEGGLLLGFGQSDLMRVAEILVLGVVAALVLLLVVRPLLGRLLDAVPAARAGQRQPLLTDQSGSAPALAGPPPVPGAAAAALAQAESVASEIDQMIDINQVEGRVRASSLKKIGEIVERHPEEAVNIMRSWMFQES
ncbi:MAG TPA: flagellar basal-body MS-ring/collar protein FliF [Dongiaceae bacterium]|nr:flagellar basal-body MS-ring/collar protein FliF [Dongiaceae bacterium]